MACNQTQMDISELTSQSCIWSLLHDVKLCEHKQIAVTCMCNFLQPIWSVFLISTTLCYWLLSREPICPTLALNQTYDRQQPTSNIGWQISCFSYFGPIFVLLCHTFVLLIEYGGGVGIFVPQIRGGVYFVAKILNNASYFGNMRLTLAIFYNPTLG